MPPALGKDEVQESACSDRKVRLADDTALVTGRAEIEAEINGHPRSLRLVFLNAWTKTPKGWKFIAWQSTLQSERTPAQMSDAAALAIRIERPVIATEDGRSFDGHLGRSAKVRGPDLIIFSEMWGVAPSKTEMAEDYARRRWCAYAPNMFWRSEFTGVVPFEEADQAWRRLNAFDWQGRASVDLQVLSNSPPQLLQSLLECFHARSRLRVVLGEVGEDAHTAHSIRLLRARRERIRRRRAEQRDEVAAFQHSVPC